MPTLEALERVMKESWGADTCYPPLVEQWSPENPALGQCAVTALIVQDFFGGSLAYCRPLHHYYNMGVPLVGHAPMVDLTRSQFPADAIITHDETRTREHVLGTEDAIRERTAERYRILSERVRAKIVY